MRSAFVLAAIGLTITGCKGPERRPAFGPPITQGRIDKEEIQQRPGRPPMLRKESTEWYSGPLMTAPGAVLPAAQPPATPLPMPRQGGGVSMPAPIDDPVIPKGKIIGIYGVGPNGERIPAQSYDQDGRPLQKPAPQEPILLPPVPPPASEVPTPRITPVPALPPALPPTADRTRTA